MAEARPLRQRHTGGVTLHLPVRVIPRASKPGIAGTRAGALLVRLQSPPVEGAANDELIDIIARTFHVAKHGVTITSGAHSKLKRVAIATIDRRRVDAVLRTMGIDPEDISSF